MKYCYEILYKIGLKIIIFTMVILSGGYTDAQEIESDTSGINVFFNHIINVHEEVISNPNRQVGNFSDIDSTSLPIGIVKEIGNTIYAICIDSARFTPDGAFFSVYMAIDFPGSDKKLAFAAKNIQFNPEGVIVNEGAKLQLISQQVINIGPKLQMVFKDNGKNFIEWDCNGYKQAGISADFIINSDLLINASDSTAPVKAGMELVVSDLNNIVFTLPSMTPFRVKGAKDFIFNLSNITIDRSEFTTPDGVNLTPENLQLYNNDLNSWKGFYAENATVTLPQKLSRGDEPMQIYANNLLIDDAGLTGNFGVNNLFTDGKMNGAWGFTVSNLEVGIRCNHLNSGSLSGTIIVPPLDDKAFSYSASISQQPDAQDLDYTFTLGLANGAITMSAFKSTLVLEPSSQLEIVSSGGKFIPTARLTGSWTVDFSKAKISGIQFQDLTITSQSPFITNGIFSLVANQGASQCTKFPISLSNVGMGITPAGQLTIFADIGLTLGNDNVSFAANTSVRVITKLENDQNGRLKIKYDRFAVDDIGLECETSVFHIVGLISIRNDDPVFGDLFFGSISLKIAGLLEDPFMVSVGFGKFPEYKYWFTDVSLPITIPIMAGLNITSLYGGVQNRVKTTLTNEQLLDRVGGQISITPTSSGSAIPFIPDPEMGLTFRAGVGLAATSEKVFNGDVLLSVSFNSSGGFQSIDFLGRAFLMVKRNERQNTNCSKVEGQISVCYDNSVKVLDAQIAANFVVPGILNGQLSVKFHKDPNDWYFWLNRPTQRAQVNLLNIFTVQTYFMIGTQIEAIPPPPSYVADVVGYSGSGIDLAAAGNGSGFCTGLEVAVSYGGEWPKESNWRGFVSLDIGGGFDVMIFNAENTRCSGSNSKIGVNGYYATGQVYVYLGGALGARKYKNGELKNQYNIGSLQIAALLMGKLPKPSYIYGAVGIQVEILSIIKFGFNADIEFGTNCDFVTL